MTDSLQFSLLVLLLSVNDGKSPGGLDKFRTSTALIPSEQPQNSIILTAVILWVSQFNRNTLSNDKWIPADSDLLFFGAMLSCCQLNQRHFWVSMLSWSMLINISTPLVAYNNRVMSHSSLCHFNCLLSCSCELLSMTSNTKLTRKAGIVHFESLQGLI